MAPRTTTPAILRMSLVILSPNYRSAVGFLAILLVLTIRPRGILGQRAY